MGYDGPSSRRVVVCCNVVGKLMIHDEISEGKSMGEIRHAVNIFAGNSESG